MWRRAVRVVRVIRVAPGHNITPELRSDDNIIYTKAYTFPSLSAIQGKSTALEQLFHWLLALRSGVQNICKNKIH